ncbi:hypothetical protein GBA52_028404 [Prunus armeniaca]|nr:hypothetical protein GBA52_028404 [Prunus armeniaca]
MARRKHRATPPSAAAEKSDNRRHLSMERSAYFARREAAKVLKLVLQGDAKRQSVGSIKTLRLRSLSEEQERHVCFDLSNPKVSFDNPRRVEGRRREFISGRGCGEVSHASQRGSAGSSSAAFSEEKVKSVEELIALYDIPDISNPRYVRVNTLKMDVETAALELQKQFKVQKDDLVPDLLVLPPGSDLHDHHLIKNGNVFMQGKASSMVAAALAPKPEWEVRAILLDPSCSGSGTASARLDHLLPSSAPVPDVERVVYSTCSVNQVENEDVVKSVLPLAASNGFQLETPSQNGTAVVSRLSRALNACFGLIPRRTKKASSLLCLSGGALGISQRNLTPTDTLTELRRQREVMWELISICLKCLHMSI